MTARILARAGLVAFVTHFAVGQSSVGQAFEVASIKVSQSRDRASVNTSPGRLTIDGSLSYILRWAYDLKNYQLSAPGWLEMERYHVAAKAHGAAPVKDLKLMLQTLLTEQLKLESHREAKDFPVYALVVAKGGPNLKESNEGGESVTETSKRLGAGGTSLRTSMVQFADLLDGSCPDPVVDLTGLKGRYDFTLDISSYLGGMQPGDLPAVLNEALQKQLGLNLVHRKASLEVLVIDHVEKVPVEK